MSKTLLTYTEIMKRYEEEMRRVQKTFVAILNAGLGLPEEDAHLLLKTVVKYSDDITPFDGLTNDEICSRIQYHLDLFGGVSALSRFLEAQERSNNIRYAPYYRKKTLLYLPVEEVGEIFDRIRTKLNASKDECVEFLIAKPGCLFRPFSYFEKHFVEAQEYWGLSEQDTAKFFIKYPLAFAKKSERLDNRIQRINEYFDVDIEKIKKLLLTYPKLLERSPSFFERNRIPELVFEKPWILECITGYKDSNYGGYRIMDSFLKYITFVERYFGRIIGVERWMYGDNLLLGFVTKLKESTYYVSVGAGLTAPECLADPIKAESSEAKLLKSIFGDKIPQPTYCQELIDHCEIYARIDGSFESIEFITYVRNLLETKIQRGCQFKEGTEAFENCQKGYVIDEEHPESLEIPYDEENNLRISFKRLQVLLDGTIGLRPHFGRHKKEHSKSGRL